MPSPLLSIRETDPEVAAYVTKVAERDFAGNRSAAVIALLRASMEASVTGNGGRVTGKKPPRKTTVRRSQTTSPKVTSDADALCRKEGHPLKGRKAIGKKWFCGRCGEMI